MVEIAAAAADLTMSVRLIAQETSGVLARSFAIAVAIMAPVALWQWWRIRSRRRAQQSAAYQQVSELSPIDAAERGPSLEGLVADIGRLGSTLEPAATTTVSISAHLTVGGSPAEPTLVEAVVRDALERSGLEVTGTTGDGATVLIECRRR